MHERKSRTADLTVKAHAAGEPSCKSRFPRAQVSEQCHNIACLETSAELRSEFLGLF